MAALSRWLPSSFYSYLPNALLPFSSGVRQQRQAQQMMAAFLTAMEEGNLEMVRFLLQQHLVDPNAGSLLHVACANSRHAEAARILLEHGADPRQRDRNGVTPLMLAANSGSRSLVEKLLSRGADAATETPDGRTALQFALGSHEGCLEVDMVRRLLEAGAGTEACRRLAASWTSADANVGLLTAAALGVRLDWVGTPAYQLAAEYAVRRAVIEKAAEGSAELLAAAARQGVNLDFCVACQEELLTEHLTSQVPQRLRSSKDGALSLSPGSAAVLCNQLAVLRLLHSLRVPLDRRDCFGYSLLFVASAMGRVEALSFLLSIRCSASAKSHSGLTAAHLCAMDCPAEFALPVLQLLTKRGAPADKADSQGKTPAQHLLERGLLPALRYLAGFKGCDAGRLLCAPDGSRLSLLELAVKRGWDAEVVQRLTAAARQQQPRCQLAATAELLGLLSTAAAAGRWRLLEALFARGVWPEAAAASALIRSAQQGGHARTLRLLVEQLGLPVDSVDVGSGGDGQTALTRATLGERPAEVAELLALGADPLEGVNADGSSAVQLAVERVEDQGVFEELDALFEDAEPRVWPVNRATADHCHQRTAAQLTVAESPMTLEILGRETSYCVIEYRVTFREPVNLFRMSRSGSLPVVGDILTDLGRRLQRHRRLTVRARVAQPPPSSSSSSSSSSSGPSAELPSCEFAAALTEAKLRELLCQLHQVAAAAAAAASGGLRLGGFVLLVSAIAN